MKPQSKKTSSHLSEKCGTFFSYGDRTHFSEQYGAFFSYGYRLPNPFNYCISLVPFYTIYSIDLSSLYSAAEKNEWDRRKYDILLYFPLKSLHDVDIRSSDIYIGASYGQVFVRVNYIYIGPYHTNSGAF